MRLLLILLILYLKGEIRDSIIRNDFLINDDNIGGATQELPKGISWGGRIAITFSDFRDGNSSPYFLILNLNGQRLMEEERVSDDGGLRWKGEPAVAFFDNRIAVAWEDRRNCNSDIYYQIYDSLGNRLFNNRKANDDNTSQDQRGVSIAFLPNRKFVIVWEDWRNDYGDIYLQIFDENGNKIGNNLRVNDDPIGFAWQYSASIGVKSNGQFIILWEDGRNGNWDIYCQIFDFYGNRIGNNFKINDDNTSAWQFSPRIYVNKNNYWLVVWEDERNGNWDIYAQIFDSLNRRIGNNFLINDDNTLANQNSPSCSADTLGNFIIAFSCERRGNWDIYKQRLTQEGIRIGNNELVNDDLSNLSQNSPWVVSLSNNSHLILWQDKREGNDDIYAQFYDENNIKIGNNFKINNDYASSHQRCPFISANQQFFGICWEDERKEECHIYATFFDTLGNFLIPNKKISEVSYNFFPSFGLNCYNKALVAWLSLRKGNTDIYGQIITPFGNLIGRNFKINDDTNNNFQDWPIVASSSTGKFLVIWTDHREENGAIYGQFFDSLGNKIGNNFKISDNNEGDALYGFITFADTLPIFTWMDNRLGEYNIYLKIGNNPSILVNDITNNFQGYPTCAFKDSIIVVSWEDERNGNTDIYCQIFKINGERIGRNILVNDDHTVYDQYSPSISFTADGEFVITFCDFRKGYGDVDVYAQRFDYFGNKISNNRLVHEPDWFFGNNQWILSQSISSINNFLCFSWIDNRRHKGWDVYAKIVKKNYLFLEDIKKTKIISKLDFKEEEIFSVIGKIYKKNLRTGIYFVKKDKNFKKIIYLKGAIK
ncbi:MAG: hypothetical protein N2323_06235 [candidate division WOR-3 bacterium]|nr:hypothetical protein [candidate division WOR-3 bacterium]MCX7837530.1 hypothetical protein [candidate division WOR-3 bacterium]MDW8113977.1 hypothetical protein [candidate division WOR-3 bacterium]